MSKIKVNVPFTVPIEIDAEDLQLDGDFVEVVRCKDCKFWIEERCEKFKRFTDEDFYCADGKRR